MYKSLWNHTIRKSTILMVKSDHAWEQTVAGITQCAGKPLICYDKYHHAASEQPMALNRPWNFLHELGVPTVGLNALIYAGKGLEIETGIPEAELPPLLELARTRNFSTSAAIDLVHPHTILQL